MQQLPYRYAQENFCASSHSLEVSGLQKGLFFVQAPDQAGLHDHHSNLISTDAFSALRSHAYARRVRGSSCFIRLRAVVLQHFSMCIRFLVGARSLVGRGAEGGLT